jgi:hypothetical protein
MPLPPDRLERLADGIHQTRKGLGRVRYRAGVVREQLHLAVEARKMLDDIGDMRWRGRGLRRIARLEAELAELEREAEALSWVERYGQTG